MVSKNLELIFTEFKYPLNEWVKLDKIARINLTTNNSLYNECGNEKAEYYFNTDQELLYKRLLDVNGNVLKYVAVIDVNEIVSVESSNPFSESLFNGNTLIRR